MAEVGAKVFYGQLPVQSEPLESFQHSFSAMLAALGPRQREIAGILYSSTAATPRAVQARLSERCSLRVVRTLMDRMVAKGLLKRRRSGRHNEFVYIAAIVTPTVKKIAVRRMVEERFDGSFDDAIAMIIGLAKRLPRIPGTYADVRRLVNERPPGRLSFTSGSAIRAAA